MRTMLKPEYIFFNQSPASNRMEDALKLIGEQCSPYAGIKGAKLTKAFLKREAMGSTGFGEQLAIPHAKVKGLKQPMIALFRFREGIDWNAMDGQPVKIAVALIMPDGDGDNTHLKVLSRLSRKMVHQEFMETLLHTEDPNELYTFLIREMED